MSTVSIIMATYNRAHLISETLKSIQNQTYTNFECLIIDDGGTDDTAVVLQPFLKDTRFTYLKRPAQYQKGLPGCRNFGLDLAKGDFIIFFDDDDIIHPENLAVCIAEFKEAMDFVLYQKQSFTTVPKIENISNNLQKRNIDLRVIDLIVQQIIGMASCTVMWRKSAIAKERFQEYLQYAEEWEFYSRLIIGGLKGVEIDAVLYYNRKHSNSNTGEFYQQNPQRIQSKIQAIKLVYTHLIQNNLLSFKLYQYFINYSKSFQHKTLTQYLQKKTPKNILTWWIFKSIDLKVWLYWKIKK